MLMTLEELERKAWNEGDTKLADLIYKLMQTYGHPDTVHIWDSQTGVEVDLNANRQNS